MSRSKRLFRRIARKLPGVVLCNDMLVVSPTEHILRGFLLENTMRKDEVYLWRVVTPLYRPMSRVFLDYSKRVPDGEPVHVETQKIQKSADRVGGIIGAHFEFLQALRTPQDFLSSVTWRIGSSGILFRFDLALTYYQIGDVRQAAGILQDLVHDLDQLEVRRRLPIDRLIKQAAQVIDRNPVGLAQLLDEWETENVETLSLQPSRWMIPVH